MSDLKDRLVRMGWVEETIRPPSERESEYLSDNGTRVFRKYYKDSQGYPVLKAVQGTKEWNRDVAIAMIEEQQND